MKKVCLGLFLLISAARTFAADDPVTKVAAMIRQGKISELTAVMAESVDISIAGDDNTYSKTEAVGVLNNFFSQNKPLSVKVLHKINSNPKYHFGVLLINTGKGVYRIALTFKEVNGALQLIELRIETEKVR
jgi:hypothetical protein